MGWKLLSNPLAVLGREFGLIMAAFVVVIFTVVAGTADVRLEGAMVPCVGRASALVLIAESFGSWLGLGVFFFAAAKLFRGRGGLSGYIAAAGLGRFPYILIAILLSRPLLGRTMHQLAQYNRNGIVMDLQQLVTPLFIIGVMAMALLILWSIVMLYQGFKEASRLQGLKALIAFILSLSLTELIIRLISGDLWWM